jgi:hypothetical protein
MLGVHLHQAKKLGENLRESNAGFDLSSLGAAIRSNAAHPHLHLDFWIGSRPKSNPIIARTATNIDKRNSDYREVFFATFLDYYDGITIQVLYTNHPGRPRRHGWHPSSASQYLRLKATRKPAT